MCTEIVATREREYSMVEDCQAICTSTVSHSRAARRGGAGTYSHPKGLLSEGDSVVMIEGGDTPHGNRSSLRALPTKRGGVQLERGMQECLTDMDCKPIDTGRTLPDEAMLWTGMESYRVLKYAFPPRELEVRISGSPPPWVYPTIAGLAELLSLPVDWDTYGASRIELRCVESVLQVARDTFRDDTPAPSVVPTSRGSVQLEWHTRRIDLEVEFITPSRLRVSYENEPTGEAWESDLTRDLKPLTDAIAILSRSA